MDSPCLHAAVVGATLVKISMTREFSAGAVVLRHMKEQWWVAAIEPGREGEPEDRKHTVALPTGHIGEIADNMKHEVRRAYWLPLDEAAKKLTYSGERQMARKAAEYLEEHPDGL